MRKKSKPRNWKLKGLSKEEEDAKRVDKTRVEQDYELFLRDLEEDPELRSMINLYKGL